jgi:hypothetical protein
MLKNVNICKRGRVREAGLGTSKQTRILVEMILHRKIKVMS